MIALAVTETQKAILTVQNLTKRFPPNVQALNDANLSLEKGKMYALVGENGAGKTTLLKIIFGLYKPSSGRVFFKGEDVTGNSTPENIDKRMAMVTQELSLISTFDSIENTALQREFSRKLVLDLSDSGHKLSQWAGQLEFKTDLRKKIAQLPLEECQKLEVLRRLSCLVDLLMLDEPSTMLTPLEEEQMLYALKNLVVKFGLTVVITTHKFQNLLKYPDEIVVMRKGTVVLHDKVEHLSLTDVIKAVTGEEPRRRTEADRRVEAAPLLELKSLNTVDRLSGRSLKDVSLTVHGGEFVGVVGSAFSGKDVLAKAIMGMAHNTQGSVIFDGEDITREKTKHILSKGLDCIFKDREMMQVPTLSVAENIVLNQYYEQPFCKNFFMNRAAMEALAEKAVSAFAIKTPSISTPVKSLSGGNQRKVMIARALLKESKLVIAEEPTIGLDIRTSQEVMDYLVRLRNRGGGVILISEELGDVITYSDTVYVLYEGTVKSVLPASEVTINQLGGYMLGLDKV